MAADIEIKWDGFEGIVKLLNKLSDSAQRRVSRFVLTKHSKGLHKAVKGTLASSLAASTADRSRRTGNLEGSLHMVSKARVVRKYQSGTLFVAISGEWPRGGHIHLLEFGTPKFKGWGFMRRAWDQASGPMVAAIKEEFPKQIAIEALRLRKGITKKEAQLRLGF